MTNADLLIYQGDDKSGLVTVLDASGADADLTGFTARAQIRRNVADRDPTVVVDIPLTIMLPNTIILSIPHAETEKLNGKYVWDLQIVSPAGIVTTILAGRVPVSQEVTREGEVANARAKVYR